MQTTEKSNSVCTSRREGRDLVFAVVGAGKADLRLAIAKIHPANVERATYQGFNQRCVNAAAIPKNEKTGQSATPLQKWEAIEKLVSHLNSGSPEWSPARVTLTPEQQRAAVLAGLDAHCLAAIAAHTGREVEAIRGLVDAGATKRGCAPDVYLAALCSNPEVAAKVDALRAASVTLDPTEDLMGMMA